jgi:hypothetical protein
VPSCAGFFGPSEICFGVGQRPRRLQRRPFLFLFCNFLVFLVYFGFFLVFLVFFGLFWKILAFFVVANFENVAFFVFCQFFHFFGRINDALEHESMR